ncbi:hypothetical protein SteCoe_34537 [Stentor coeruleus]|uniref:Enkurin domain-containing protein n=1 Tax=Stentor coeruleus TaxID=5963 RepID=A0A1R2AUF6_9CILI|nr:hypothetical protein SteCoe_34537 [Stentor coeruleus]
MSSAFQERFKNRANFIGKQGIIDIGDSNVIQKPNTKQVYDFPYETFKSTPAIKTTYPNFPISSYEIESQRDPFISNPKPTQSQSRKQILSARPYRNIKNQNQNQTRINVITQQGHKPFDDYKPYTLKDYQNIKSDKYYELGGLGASNVGTDEWKLRKEMIEKRLSYGKQVKIANANLPPVVMKKTLKEEVKVVSKAERAKQFARMIPKPVKKEKKECVEEEPAISSVLDELEKQHLAYKASVDAIRSEYS